MFIGTHSALLEWVSQLWSSSQPSPSSLALQTVTVSSDHGVTSLIQSPGLGWISMSSTSPGCASSVPPTPSYSTHTQSAHSAQYRLLHLFLFSRGSLSILITLASRGFVCLLASNETMLTILNNTGIYFQVMSELLRLIKAPNCIFSNACVVSPVLK